MPEAFIEGAEDFAASYFNISAPEAAVRQSPQPIHLAKTCLWAAL